jgi:hypothetical protein
MDMVVQVEGVLLQRGHIMVEAVVQVEVAIVM